MVGTTNRSMAAMSGAWLRTKVHHSWEGGPYRLTMYFATLDCATSKPSLSSSPWIRGAPHSGLSTLIRRINARRFAAIAVGLQGSGISNAGESRPDANGQGSRVG